MSKSSQPSATFFNALKVFGTFVQSLDEGFCQKIKSISLLKSGDPFLKIYTRLGDWPFTTALLLSMWLFIPKAQWPMVYLNALVNALLSIGVYWIVKNTVQRTRPFVQYQKAAEVPPLDKFSFPSGHTMNNLAIGYTLMAYSPWLGAIAVFFPITCGLLRVYYNVHYLSDVLGGTLLGLLCAWLGKFLLTWALL